MSFFRVSILTGALIVATVSAALADGEANRAQIQAQYMVLERAANGSDAALAKPILAEDFVGVDISGQKQPRARYLKDSYAADPSVKHQVALLSIDSLAFDGEQAVVMLRVEATADYTPQGQTATQPARLLQHERDIWNLRDGKWLMTNSSVLDVTQWLSGKLVDHRVASVALTPAIGKAVVAQLRKVVFPLRTATPDGSLTDLRPLKAMIGNARIVGMGEGTHGTSEFFSMKDRLFRFLVQNMGFTVFAMETNWTDGLKIDKYISTGKGDIRAALASTFAVWNNQEVLDLLDWMRAYNAAPGKHARLHFVGVDMQSPMDATDMVERFYAQNDPTQAARVKTDYACLHSSYIGLYQQMNALSQAARDDCKNKATALYIQTKNAALHAPGTQAQMIVHAALIAQQAATMYACNCGNDTRDAAMAQNAQWVVQQLYPRARIALWAHNGHIAASPMTYTPMGSLLRRRFGNDYYAIGFTFDKGSVAFNGVTEGTLGPAPDGSSAAIFRQVGYPFFLLNLTNVRAGSPLAGWLAKNQPVAMLGAVNSVSAAESDREYPVSLPKTFNSLIFVEQSHAAHGFQLVHEKNSVAPPRQHIPAGAGGRDIAAGWTIRGSAPNDYTEGIDANVKHDAGPSVWIASTVASGNAFGTIGHPLDITDYRGKRVRISGFLKCENVLGSASAWMRIDPPGSAAPLAFDNMHNRALKGTEDWQPFAIVLDVPKESASGVFASCCKGPVKYGPTT